MMTAALFVQADGIYFGLPNVDPWDVSRDARKYQGPHPVVAHPPCARWGNYWFGSPSKEERFTLGDDGGCFESALESVRKFGGVLEHPRGSRAWRHYGLIDPIRGGWMPADMLGGWTCCVDQGNYGHRAQKSSWLYLFGAKPPSLNWRLSENKVPVEMMSKRERAATPKPFRDLLIDIALSCSKEEGR
jgi:hypothetical protein